MIRRLSVVLLGVLPAVLSAVASAPAAEPRPAAPYVDSKAIRQGFKTITKADMDMLRSKKVLFASRSFGLNLCNGLRALAREDKTYEFLSSYKRFDVFKAGGDVSIIPADAFHETNFVHFLATYWPHTKRVEEVETLLAKPPHNFGKQVDVVIIYFHTALPKHFEDYCKKMDAMQKALPKVKFIYVTAGFMDAEKQAKANENAHAWSELVRKRYMGKRPLYDLGKILSDDYRCGHSYCPEYSKDPAGVHPNLDAGQTMMAKGFLLILRDAFKATGGAESQLDTPDSDEPTDDPAETLPENSRDYRAVRLILDANGLKDKKVEGVTVAENGRAVKLYLQEGGVKTLPAAIGTLTELRVLHVYGDRSLSHPLLQSIDPAIGRCTKLEELLMNHNDLTTLPTEVAKLANLKTLSLADNRLRNLPATVQAWARRFDPKGLADQR